MKGKSTISPANRRDIESVDAEAVAIRALDSLAASPDRLGRFLALTGLSPQTIRDVASSPGFLSAVLDHVVSDEALLLEVATETALAPESFAAARERLVPRDALPDE